MKLPIIYNCHDCGTKLKHDNAVSLWPQVHVFGFEEPTENVPLCKACGEKALALLAIRDGQFVPFLLPIFFVQVNDSEWI